MKTRCGAIINQYIGKCAFLYTRNHRASYRENIMKIRASVISHVGKIRQKNEDNFFFNEFLRDEEILTKPYTFKGKTDIPAFMAVFDGMGGITAGDKASAIAANCARDITYTLYDPDKIEDTMLEICKEANEQTCDMMMTSVKGRMGTTASMLCFFEDRYHLCNIGDSPIFVFSDNKLTEISKEHTEKDNYIRIYGADAIPPNKKFRLTQHIGIFPDELEIEPYLNCDRVKPGDRFLICSDGLTDMVSQEQIASILMMRYSDSKTVQVLLDYALKNGGRDNITIICADIL